MNLAEYWIQHRVVTLVLTFVTIGGGIMAFQGMSRLEDPEFTIKDALVVTPYVGATAEEVEQEVSDEIELAVQKLGQLKEIESRSMRNLSTVTVTVQDKYDKDGLPQVWDELRRKVSDAQSSLPPGAGPSLVIDDYGDVYGVFVAVYGSEYSYAEIKEVTDLLRRELILVQDVAKIETYGERKEAVYIELSRDRISQLGITPAAIADKLRQKNFVSNSGRVEVGPDFISIQPSGGIDSVADLGDVLISGGTKSQIYLRDVGHVRRGYVEPQDKMIRYDGNPAIGLGISTVAGGNVVVMGEALDKRIAELQEQIPLGIEAGIVSMQSTSVVKSIDGFVVSLVEAVAIVVLVLLVFMGLRSGMLIGFVLVQTILASFIFLGPMGVALERISLGALIIALGMLVDNAIVIVDGVLVKLQQGVSPENAAKQTVAQSAIPLLGATIIALSGRFSLPADELGERSDGYAAALRHVLESARDPGGWRGIRGPLRLPLLHGIQESASGVHWPALGQRRGCGGIIRLVALRLRYGRFEFLPCFDASPIHGGCLDARRNLHRRNPESGDSNRGVSRNSARGEARIVPRRPGWAALPAHLYP